MSEQATSNDTPIRMPWKPWRQMAHRLRVRLGFVCRNGCEIGSENELCIDDGYCQSCHEYPEG